MHAPDDAQSDEQRLQIVADAIVDAANAASIGLFVTSVEDPEHRVIYVSEAAARIFGYSAEELRARPLLSLIVADEIARIRDLSERARRNERGPVQFETAGAARDGRRVPIEVSLANTHLHGRRIAVTFVMDITDRKRAEAELAQSEEMFRRLIETAPEAIWISGENGFRFVNEAAAKLLGATKAELRGRSFRAFMHVEDVPGYSRRKRALLDGKEAGLPEQYRVRRTDGRWLNLEVSSMSIDFEGAPGILCFARDVTELRQVESQVLQGDRLAALGTLAGGMAHAINNPLTYVLLNLEHLSEQLPKLAESPGFLPEAVQRLLEALEGAERVAHVVRQMHAFARSDNDVPAPIDVRNVLEAALALIGNEIRHRSKLSTEYEEVPLVFATQARLEQALLNLLLHAARALPEREPRLPDVRLAVRKNEPHGLSIEVAYGDVYNLNETRGVLFEPLPALNRPADAGLAICQSIVASLGGTMRIARYSGYARALRIDLPAAEWSRPDRKSLPVVLPSIVAPSVRARVLVIDDDPGVGKALRMMLEDDYDVSTLESPREALKLLLTDANIDIVFCDLMMSEMSGKDLFQALQLNRPGYERRLVFMTGGAFLPEDAHFAARVKRPILEKPFDMQRVRALVGQALSRGR